MTISQVLALKFYPFFFSLMQNMHHSERSNSLKLVLWFAIISNALNIYGLGNGMHNNIANWSALRIGCAKWNASSHLSTLNLLTVTCRSVTICLIGAANAAVTRLSCVAFTHGPFLTQWWRNEQHTNGSLAALYKWTRGREERSVGVLAVCTFLRASVGSNRYNTELYVVIDVIKIWTYLYWLLYAM